MGEGKYVDGVVVDKNSGGTFVNIGAAKDGRLSVSRVIGVKLMRGQVLRHLLIDHVDLKKKSIALKLGDPDAPKAVDMVAFHVLATNFALAVASNKPRAKPKPKTQAKVKAKPDMKIAKAKTTPVRPGEMRPGDFVDGVVTTIASKGVVINIGSGKLGVLIVSEELQKEFQKGDRVQGMKIEKINPASGMITLSMEDPELEIDEPKAKIKTNGNSMANPGHYF